MSEDDKLQIEKDIEATIRLLRYLTHGEGYAGISVFDAGAGGGFSDGTLQVFLERSGLTLNLTKEKSLYSPKELKEALLMALWPFGDKMALEEINKYYLKREWDD